MRACVQRVSKAKVTVADDVHGTIGQGLVVLLGVAGDDTEDDARWLADKVAGLRIFSDENGNMNLALDDIGGAVLVVSQFTLMGDCRKGRRPSFIAAAPPDLAEQLYLRFAELIAERGIETATGRFRADMQVALVNDGPVTLMIDSDLRGQSRRT